MPIDALVDEILRRVDHGAVVLMKVGSPRPGQIQVAMKLKGNGHTIAGLCMDASREALEKSDHDGCLRKTEEVPGTG